MEHKPARYKKLLGGLLTFLMVIGMVAVVFAGAENHDEFGWVNDASDGTASANSSVRVYMAARPNQVATSVTDPSSPSLWFLDVGLSFTTLWSVGDDHVCVIDKETNTGAANHTGYYAVINKNVTSDDPDEFSDMTLRPIPSPEATAGNNQVSLNWSTAIEDAGTPVRTNISGYKIYRGTSQTGPFTFLTTVEGSTSTTDATALNGNTYYYVIQLVYRATSGTALTSTYYSANSNAVTPSAASSPALMSASPSSGYRGDNSLNVVIVGSNTNFVNSTTVATFGAGIIVNSTAVADPTHLTANITINIGAATGARNVTVTTGGETAIGTNIFTVNAPSTIISPTSGAQSWTGNITVSGTGSHFINGTTTAVFSGLGITANPVNVTSQTSATVNIMIDAAAATGARTLTVSTNLGSIGAESLTATFNITSGGLPTVTEITPNTGVNTTTTLVTIEGTNFTGVTAVSIDAWPVSSYTVVSPTSITAVIPSGLPAATYHVTVTSGSGTSPTSSADQFTVTSGAIPTGVVIDDFEYYAGKDYRGMMDYYYHSPSPTDVDVVTIPAPANSITVVTEGAKSMMVTYPGATGTQWGGYWGGGLNSETKDLTPYTGVSLWVKGDGTNNTVGINLLEADVAGVSQEAYAGPSFTLSDTNWHKIEIPFSAFARDPYGNKLEGAFSKVIKGYTMMYRGSQTTSTPHYLDYIVAENVSVSGLPTVAGVNPNSGSNISTTNVTITGTNFGGTTAVKIGTWDATSFTVNSATEISAVILSGLPVDTYDVTVTNGYGISAKSSADQFTVTASVSTVPTVTGVTPNTGVNTATTPVTISGTGFTGVTAVKIGTWPVSSYTVVSPTSITAVIPSGLPAAIYNVTVSNGSGTSATSAANHFTVTAHSGPTTDTTPPVISEVAFDGKLVLDKDFISGTPVITALLTDDVAIDPLSIRVQIVDAYDLNSTPAVVFDTSTGRMTLTISSPLPYGEKTFSISVKDTSGNEAEYRIIIKTGNGEEGPVFNYPNPFDPNNETTKIGFNLSDNAQVVIYLFDMTGRIVVRRPLNATVGYNEYEWNGRDDYGTIASNGVYLLRLVSENKLLGKTKIWVIKR